MLIKSKSLETNHLAKKTRDMLEASGIEIVIFVPFGIKNIDIKRNMQTELFEVHSWSENNELDIVEGFHEIESSVEYASTVAKEAELSHDIIRLDIDSFVYNGNADNEHRKYTLI